MLRNYLKIAWRNMLNHKAYSVINIIGLSIGLAACLLILQYVSFELSYENFHSKMNRIYRIQQDRYDNGKLSTQWAAGAYAAGNQFKDAIPEIEDFVKVIKNGPVTAEIDNQPVKIEKCFFASSSFFKIFTYPLVAGDPGTALSELNTAAISASTAKKLFGNTNVLGKTIELNRNSSYKVTAIFEDAPVNTQLKPDILLSYASFVNLVGPNNNPDKAWYWDGCLTYLLLHEGIKPQVVEAKFVQALKNATAEDGKKVYDGVVYKLQPITDIHLYSNYMEEPEPNGDGKTTYLLLGIAFFIAVIAWVNYVNLATARAINRAREVGIRKTLGSQRRQLIMQFLSESAVLNGIAVLIALLLVLVSIPGFNRLSGQQLSVSLFAKGQFWLWLALLFAVGVFFSGLYPAFVLSGFKPIEVLKGRMIATTQGSLLRKGLVVFQFTASLFLLIGTFTVYKQIQFMRRQSLGMNIDQTFVVRPPMVGIDSTYIQRMSALKDALKQESMISGAAISTTIPGQPNDWNAGGIKLVGADEAAQKQYRIIGMDYDYISLFDLKLVAGRGFSKDFGTDEEAVIFNRKAIEQLGFNKPAEAIGKRIDFWGRQYTIIGVTENFHQQSLREAYEPLIFRFIPDIRGYVSVRTNAAQTSQSISKLKSLWNKFLPGNTFEYFFLDQHFSDQYKADQRFGQVFGLFTSLAILVACLGLFGLASFTTLQRTKEIGIRKVLGATVQRILRLLYKEFAVLLVIAFLIAIPVSWIVLRNWLNGYAFRIDVHWSFFLLPFVLIMLIAMLTVSFQSIKTALANPVKSLRTE